MNINPPSEREDALQVLSQLRPADVTSPSPAASVVWLIWPARRGLEQAEEPLVSRSHMALLDNLTKVPKMGGF
jgi:hypothetical protein